MREKGVHSRLSESANKDAERQNSEKLRVTEALWVRVRASPSDLLCQGSWNCFLSFFSHEYMLWKYSNKAHFCHFSAKNYEKPCIWF